MKYYKEIVLKNGQACILRSAEPGDGADGLSVFRLTHAEGDTLLSYPDEINYTVEAQEKFLLEKAASSSETELMAFVDGKMVALAGIEAVGSKYKLAHRADFGVSVLRDYWGLGIGTALLEACIHCAKEAGYIQLELSAVADNDAALSLYKKAGFIEYGRNPRGFRSRFSGFQELVYMYLLL